MEQPSGATRGATSTNSAETLIISRCQSYRQVSPGRRPCILGTQRIPDCSDCSTMTTEISSILNLRDNPINEQQFQNNCRQSLNTDGVLLMQNFLKADAIESIRRDGENNSKLAYFTSTQHNVYLSPVDDTYPSDHARNRLVTSSKGCITTDRIPAESLLHDLYNSDTFKHFLCAVLDEQQLHEYADPLSSINLHYASEGQELGWHFDNSSFAITLLIQKPEQGGVFEYRKDARNAEQNNMNFELVERVLDRKEPVDSVEINPGDLVLFRGRNSMHRVSPTIGETTRVLVVLAYNTEPGISLSESARQTFYGRLS